MNCGRYSSIFSDLTHDPLAVIAWLSIELVFVRHPQGWLLSPLMNIPGWIEDCVDKFHEKFHDDWSPDQDCEYLPIAPIIQTLFRFADGHDVHDFNEAVNNPICSENYCNNASEG
jgi:hypothetical protein